jgi:hypothetical protein
MAPAPHRLAPPTDAPRPNDARLLALAAAIREAEADIEAAAVAWGEVEGTPAAQPHIEARKEAGTRLVRLLVEMAGIPADGLAGIAAKAARVAFTGAGGCGSLVADDQVADSLQDDIARLVPEARAA